MKDLLSHGSMDTTVTVVAQTVYLSAHTLEDPTTLVNCLHQGSEHHVVRLSFRPSVCYLLTPS